MRGSLDRVPSVLSFDRTPRFTVDRKVNKVSEDIMALLSFARHNHPIDTLLRLQDELEHAFGGTAGSAPGLSGRGTHPPANLFKDSDGYVLTLEAPGFDAQNVSVETVGQSLKLSGKRDSEEPANASPHRRECFRGEFQRSLQFPADADLNRSDAKMRNGLLTIRVPFKAETQPRQIEITSS